MPETRQWTALDGGDRKRIEAVVETLARLRGDGQSLAELAHDARNMVTALSLYCELLEEPGVLAAPYRHYGNELRLVASASRRLVEKMVALDTQRLDTQSLDMQSTDTRSTDPARWGMESLADPAAGLAPATRWQWNLPSSPHIESLSRELLANRNLLAAIAGPRIALTVEAEGGALPVRLTPEDLTRILVNLVKNAAEAMASGGRIQLRLRERAGLVDGIAEGSLEGAAEAVARLALSIEDDGPGIPRKALDEIFEPGYTTHMETSPGRLESSPGSSNWPAMHRGLGLSITRSLVETAGGRIYAANSPEAGAHIEIELPVWTP